MVLVDSSLWIAESRDLLVMDDHAGGERRAICPPIVHEVLRGARTAKLEKLLRDSVGAAHMLEAPMPLEVFEEAARLFRTCQDRGITPGFADSLIAVCAIRNNVPLLTLDTDFRRIAEITPLQLFTRS